MAYLNFIKLIFYLLYSFVLLCDSYANDILGCGGFVKSHVSLDFSKIEIGLYTREGSLKEKTECAPTNGYYFLPLYEKGEYILKVHPPPGWSFEPSKVDITVDGLSDPCSSGQDINFSFNGFGITGRVVTAGQTQGPSGISIHLVNEKGDTRETITSKGGDFHFTPVIPGKYTIKASHPKWKLEPSQVIVQVKEGNTALPVGLLAVKGYEVRGSVGMAGHPITGLHVLLYSKENLKFRVEGCKTALLQGVPDAPICYSVSDDAGEFSFGMVPAGEYKLQALAKPPGQAIVTYSVKPESIKFTVQHDGQFIKNAFEVIGFTVTGAVVSAPGVAMSGVRVAVNGVPAGSSDSAGKYTLTGLQPGVYRLSFSHEHSEFDDVQLSITPSGAVTLNDARPSTWKVCGVVTPTDPRDVIFKADRSSLVKTVSISKDGQGKWCTYLPPGTYTVHVEVSDEEERGGLQFFPVSEKVTVRDGPVGGVTFSQLYCAVSGAVQCAHAACRPLAVTLRALAADGRYVGEPREAPVLDGEYRFEAVTPGMVEVSVPQGSPLCWAASRLQLRVAPSVPATGTTGTEGTAGTTVTTVRAPTLRHTGHAAIVVASHETQLDYESADTKDKGTFEIRPGETRVCVRTAGKYTLTPRSCHKFQPPSALIDTDSGLPTVKFTATAHSVYIQVVSPEKVSDLTLKISFEDKGIEEVGPLTAVEDNGQYVYAHTIYMRESEVSVISAHSATLLFTPAAPQQVTGARQCQTLPPVAGRRGLVLCGRLAPPVDGATVSLRGGDDIKQTVTTGPDGKYCFGPLDPTIKYTITAEKESYVMGPRQPNGDIHAHKLAEILLELRDKDTGALLQGGLVSVSGGAYRKNQVTDVAGRLAFASLAPGQYYVKPLMKEYRFSPPHHLIDVLEGNTHRLTLSGTRVAWSCSGTLVSVGGAGWASAQLSAVPRGDTAQCRVEDALTEQDGSFRIRGLLPKCLYDIQLKESNIPELAALKLAASPPPIEVKENKDLEGLRLVGIQRQQVTDVSVVVRARNVDHYRALRLQLSPEETPSAQLHTARLDAAGFSTTNNPGVMYVLPRLPADNKTYMLVLESSLSKATHSYENKVLYFNSDGQFKFFDIEFAPKVKSSDQELRQTSLLVVPLLLAIGAAFLYREQLLGRLSAAANAAFDRAKAKTNARAAPRPDLLDKASIDQIVSSVNAAGKKTSKKKTPFSN